MKERSIPSRDLSGMAACFTTLGTDKIGPDLACFVDVLDNVSHEPSVGSFWLEELHTFG